METTRRPVSQQGQEDLSLSKSKSAHSVNVNEVDKYPSFIALLLTHVSIY